MVVENFETISFLHATIDKTRGNDYARKCRTRKFLLNPFIDILDEFVIVSVVVLPSKILTSVCNYFTNEVKLKASLRPFVEYSSVNG
jgi:hypothetical protein